MKTLMNLRFLSVRGLSNIATPNQHLKTASPLGKFALSEYVIGQRNVYYSVTCCQHSRHYYAVVNPHRLERHCLHAQRTHHRQTYTRSYQTGRPPDEDYGKDKDALPIESSLNVVSDQKLLRVAVVGIPNAGKSTFVNCIVGNHVSAVSHVAHTTRGTADGICNIDNTQIVFTDTPGIISHHEGRRLGMDKLMVRAPRRAVYGVDMIIVLHDASMKKTRSYIDQNILELVKLHQDIPSVLVMNKIDLITHKTNLLKTVDYLMEDREKDEYGYLKTGGYSGFKSVFMVSSLEGDGMSDLVQYFMDQARPANWMYPANAATNTPLETQISEIFREKILVMFGQEIPWQMHQTCTIRMAVDGQLNVHQKITWPRKSQTRWVEMHKEAILEAATRELNQVLDRTVHITLSVGHKKRMAKQLMHFY